MLGISDEEVFKLMDVFSIVDSACLIAGVSPNQAYFNEQYCEWELNTQQGDPDNARHIFSITLNTLKNSVKTNKISAVITLLNTNNAILTKESMSTNWLLTHDIDLSNTTIERDDLVNWLKQKNVFPPIFFPQGRISDISNTEHKFYCPKLHLIIDAWESLFTADIQSTTIKKHLEYYMSVNKAKYRGLAETKESSISNLAEIANFDKGGSTIVGNPLHHFGIENKHQDSEVKKGAINPQTYANFTSKKDGDYDVELPF